MGQMTVGVMFGCRMTVNSETRVLLDEWNNDPKHKPMDDVGDAETIVGVWVVKYEEDDINKLAGHPMEFKALEKTPEFMAAWKEWKRFKNWAKRKKLKTRSPKLYFASVEVA